MRRFGWWLVVIVAAAATAAGGVLVADRPGKDRPETRGEDLATVAVERTDLSTARTMPGTLGYGVPRTIRGTGGTVTWLPRVGRTIKRGQALYRNDDRPVVVLYGTTPLFRRLDSPGLAGRDVRVVVQNLRALGYRTGDQPTRKVRPGDGVLTPELVQAVKAWQLDVGVPVTGAVDPADVVVLPGPMRVSRLTANPGDPAESGVLVLTGSRKAVTVPVRAGEIGTIRIGAAVRIELPGGTTTGGKVARIDRDVRQPEGAEQTDASTAEVEVTVTLGSPAAVKAMDTAPVQVSFPGESHDDVLAVPVAALLALREGGHAVQVAGGPLLPVETGMFAMGLVEISGAGLSEGMTVVTAA